MIGGLATGPFDHCTVYTEVLQDRFMDFFDQVRAGGGSALMCSRLSQGKLDFASATSIRFSAPMFERLYSK